MLNLNSSDLFEMSSLTAALNSSSYIPGHAAELFTDVEGMQTTTAVVDSREGVISLINAQTRGGAAGALDSEGTKAPVALIAQHYPLEEIITPSDIQNIRLLGESDQLESLQTIRDRKLAIMRKKHMITLEHQRVEALKGSLTNSVGGSVDLFAAFGGTQIEVNMALDSDSTSVKSKVLDAVEAIEDEMGDLQINGFVAYCGKTWWRDFIEHPAVKEAYARWNDGAALRDDMRSGFMFNDVMFKRYRGSVNGSALIGNDDAYIAPISDIFCTRFAPADMLDGVNTASALPMVAKAKELDYSKGVGIWSESNSVSFVKKPSAVLKLNRTTV